MWVEVLICGRDGESLGVSLIQSSCSAQCIQNIIHTGEKSLLMMKVKLNSYTQKNKWFCLLSCAKCNYKCFRNFTVRPNALENTLEFIGTRKDFLNRTPNSTDIKTNNCTKFNSRQIKDLRPDTLGNTFRLTGQGKDSVNGTPTMQALRSIINNK